MATLNNGSGAHEAESSPPTGRIEERQETNPGSNYTHGRDPVPVRDQGQVQVPVRDQVEDHDDAAARDKFGGLNLGAAFFGWLVAIAIAILLTSIVGAVLAAVGSTTNVTQSDAERAAGTIGVATGIVLLAVLTIAYFTGGYVAGRMSRFDGARQGVGVWVIGLLVTLVALALGAIFGTQYNILDRVNLPRIPVSTDQLGWGGIITAVLVLVLTLLGAIAGGTVGHRYHDRVDRAAYR
jgi:amino acid transporter